MQHAHAGELFAFLWAHYLAGNTLKWGNYMAAHGEWNRKGATLSDVTAKAEYGVSRDFIAKGIQTGALEYREASIWGSPFLRVLRSQLEKYIAVELGEDYLLRVKNQTELRRVKKEISDLKKGLERLQERQNELEASLDK